MKQYRILIIYTFFFLFSDFLYQYFFNKFINSFEKEININYFLISNLFSLIYTILSIFNSLIITKYLEYPSKKYIKNDILFKVSDMPIIWIENNINYIYNLIDKSSVYYYNKNFQLLEGFTAFIKVFYTIYLISNINFSIFYIIIVYMFSYFYFYKNVVLYNREFYKNNSNQKLKLNIKNQNSYNYIYNSILHNCYYKLCDKINNLSNEINNYNLENIKYDILYKSVLSLSQKFLIFIIYYNYLINNNITKMSLLFLPLYIQTNNFIYQYEYILHNYYSYKVNDFNLSIYYDFCKLHKKYRSYLKTENYIQDKIIINNFDINFCNNSDNRTKLYVDINIDLTNTPILLKAKSGVGKTTICKMIASHFPNYSNNLKKNILFIPQDTIISYSNRSLLNILTNNDIYENKINYDIYAKIQNIIPINDIINSFKKNSINNIIEENNVFSAGQSRRIFLFMYLYHLFNNINNYKIVIVDELEKNLDAENFNFIFNNLLETFKQYNLKLIIISHYNIDKIKSYNVKNEENILKLEENI